MRAAELAARAALRRDLGDPWEIAKIYWNRVPRPVAEEAFARLREALPELQFDRAAAVGDVPGVVDEATVTTEIDGSAYAAAKAAAMRAHATQITVDGPWFVLSNELAQPLFTTEYYELAGAPRPAARERDLFEGTGTAPGREL
jgi:N-acetyl-1-D-myo-inositol-2-amino-2-deoxy-alpha-D-glucopyranoside deacetylase